MTRTLLLSVGLIISYFLTGILRRYAKPLKLVDVPNERSSHVIPTPRGGGLVFTSVFLVIFCYLVIKDNLNPFINLFFIFAASITAGIGLLDDRHNMSAKTRFVCHMVSVTILLFAVNYKLNIINELWLMMFLFLSGLWMINLYNFMDGIDGLAAIELLTIGAILLLLMTIVPDNSQLLMPIALMMCCVGGFILWNWAPAKIFMGDIGSGFIGFFFFYLILMSNMSLLTWAILLAGFWVDTTYTLIYRVFTKQKWYQAHRSHAYQKLAIRWSSHAKVSISLAIINIVWLFPLSVASVVLPSFKWLLVFIAISPLLAFCIYIKAGKPDK